MEVLEGGEEVLLFKKEWNLKNKNGLWFLIIKKESSFYRTLSIFLLLCFIFLV
jgi:hypothetical protein